MIRKCDRHLLHNVKVIAKILGGVVYDERAVLPTIVIKHITRYDNYIVCNVDKRYLLFWLF